MQGAVLPPARASYVPAKSGGTTYGYFNLGEISRAVFEDYSRTPIIDQPANLSKTTID